MASARAWVFTVFLLACLLATDGFLWPPASRRRRRRCPSPYSVVPDAINSWDETIHQECPFNQAISRVESAHCNTAEDRVWRFECQHAAGISYLIRHYWTGWINDYDKRMSALCPYDSVVTGFQSQHSNSKQDRRWKLRCSKKLGMRTHSCKSSGYVNEWDNAMDYSVPASFYVTGMHGYHSNSKEDRRYKFTLCKVTP